VRRLLLPKAAGAKASKDAQWLSAASQDCD
jgi:hypothetical protein